ncbi:hypothetical protein CYMTET_50592, partial [Cymbomonas tetramitiformis]
MEAEAKLREGRVGPGGGGPEVVGLEVGGGEEAGGEYGGGPGGGGPEGWALEGWSCGAGGGGEQQVVGWVPEAGDGVEVDLKVVAVDLEVEGSQDRERDYLCIVGC